MDDCLPFDAVFENCPTDLPKGQMTHRKGTLAYSGLLIRAPFLKNLVLTN